MLQNDPVIQRADQVADAYFQSLKKNDPIIDRADQIANSYLGIQKANDPIIEKADKLADQYFGRPVAEGPMLVGRTVIPKGYAENIEKSMGVIAPIAKRFGEQLIETPKQIIGGGIEAVKQVVEKPETLFPSMKEALKYVSTNEGQAELAKAGYENVKGLLLFLPDVAVRFVKNPIETIKNDPLGVFFLGAMGFGVGMKTVGKMARQRSVPRPEQIKAAINEIAPTPEALAENVNKLKALSEEPKPLVEQPREVIEPSVKESLKVEEKIPYTNTADKQATFIWGEISRAKSAGITPNLEAIYEQAERRFPMPKQAREPLNLTTEPIREATTATIPEPPTTIPSPEISPKETQIKPITAQKQLVETEATRMARERAEKTEILPEADVTGVGKPKRQVSYKPSMVKEPSAFWQANKKTLDPMLTALMEKESVPNEARSDITIDAMSHFKPKSMETLETDLTAFVNNRKKIARTRPEQAEESQFPVSEETGMPIEDFPEEQAVFGKEKVESKKADMLADYLEKKHTDPKDKAILRAYRAGGESARNIEKELGISKTEVADRLKKIREEASGDPEARKIAEKSQEEVEALYEKAEAENVPKEEHSKWALAKILAEGQNLHFAQLVELPRPVQILQSKVSTAFSDIYKHGIADQIRMPGWNEIYSPIVDMLTGAEGTSQRVSTKSARMADPYFRTKNKEKIHEALSWEDENESLLSIDELKKRGLSNDEIKGYKGIRNAISFSFEKNIARLMKQNGFNPKEIDAFIKEHYVEGYVPHKRFGRFSVYSQRPWMNKAGQRKVEFSTFETKLEANEYAEKFRQEYFNKYNKNPESNHLRVIDLKEIQRNVTPLIELLQNWPMVDAMLKKGIVASPEMIKIRETLGEEILKEFASGRLAHRKGTPGWSKDYERSFKEYMNVVPFSFEKRFLRAKVEKAVSNLPAEKRKYGQDLVDYWYGDKQYEGKINRGVRKALYDYYLGFKPSFFFVNITQRALTTVPHALAERGTYGIKAAIRAQVKEIRIYKDYLKHSGKVSMRETIAKAKYLSLEEKRILQNLAQEGELGAARQKEIRGKEYMGEMNPILLFGTLSEHSNRIHAALTAIDIGKSKGMKLTELEPYTKEFINKTQFKYSKATRAKVSRGIGAPVMVFKSFLLNYMNFMGETMMKSPVAAGLSAATMLGLGGLGGSPFYAAAKAMVKLYLKQNAGMDDDKAELTINEIEKGIDKKTKGILLHGIPAIVGIDGDVAFGAPDLFNLVPFSVYESGKSFVRGLGEKGVETGEKLTRIAPVALKHILRLYQVKVKNEMPSDVYGKPKLTEEDIKRMPKEIREYARKVWDRLPKPKDMDDIEGALYGIGFPSKTLSDYNKEIYDLKKLAKGIGKEKSGVGIQIAKEIANNATPHIRAKLDSITEGKLKQNFWTYIGGLPKDSQEKIRRIIKEFKDKGYEDISYSSIAYHLKEYIHD